MGKGRNWGRRRWSWQSIAPYDPEILGRPEVPTWRLSSLHRLENFHCGTLGFPLIFPSRRCIFLLSRASGFRFGLPLVEILGWFLLPNLRVLLLNTVAIAGKGSEEETASQNSYSNRIWQAHPKSLLPSPKIWQCGKPARLKFNLPTYLPTYLDNLLYLKRPIKECCLLGLSILLFKKVQV